MFVAYEVKSELQVPDLILLTKNAEIKKTTTVNLDINYLMFSEWSKRCRNFGIKKLSSVLQFVSSDIKNREVFNIN